MSSKPLNWRMPSADGTDPTGYTDPAYYWTNFGAPAGPDSTGSTFLLSSASRSGNNGGTGGTVSSGAALAPTIVTTTSSPLVVDITWDSSVSSAPAGFTAGVIAAVQYLESQFTDAVTINIDVGYGEVGGSSLGSNALGESETYLTSVSYSQLVAALKADATSATDASVLASLPATSPVSGTYWISTAEAKALGLVSATASALDGYVGFSSTLPFTYNDSSGVAAGTYDFIDVVLHEITEVMGRLLLTGSTIGSTPHSYTLLDLLHYAASGTRDFSASTPGYFSVNGGVTNLGNFNTVSGGDAGDWAASVTNNAFDAFSSSGVVNSITPADLTEMDAIGWNLATLGGSTSTPTGVSLSAVTTSLAQAPGSSGLTANIALATVAQTGGLAGDSYSYALGGAGAGSFALSTAHNVATLSAGTSGVAGAANFDRYALTLTATDTTAGNSSPAVPVNVLVGSSGSDTVNLSLLSGILPSAPTFIYGLGGNDTINGKGMTGKLYIDGGAGADTMTGGSGGNDYLYSAVSDSTRSAMDIITNFVTATDLIDLTGLGIALNYVGKDTSTSLAAHSIGWQVSGGNTYLYVNTSSVSEKLTATDMKIELAGKIALTSSDIIHL